MSTQSRLMLVVSPLMEHSPAFDRAAALAKAEGAALHIVAFDYLEGLATAGLVNEQALEQMRLGYIERHRQWLEEQARPCEGVVGCAAGMLLGRFISRVPVGAERLFCRPSAQLCLQPTCCGAITHTLQGILYSRPSTVLPISLSRLP